MPTRGVGQLPEAPYYNAIMVSIKMGIHYPMFQEFYLLDPKFILQTYYKSLPVLGFRRRSHKQPIPCPSHGHLIQPLACSWDIKLYLVNHTTIICQIYSMYRMWLAVTGLIPGYEFRVCVQINTFRLAAWCVVIKWV